MGIGKSQQVADLRQTVLLAPQSLAARTRQEGEQALSFLAQRMRCDPERTIAVLLVDAPQSLCFAIALTAGQMTKPRFDRSPGIAHRGGGNPRNGELRETLGRREGADSASAREARERHQREQGGERSDEEGNEHHRCCGSAMGYGLRAHETSKSNARAIRRGEIDPSLHRGNAAAKGDPNTTFDVA